MFYSRPDIAPLAWDLVAVPTPNGSRNFDGLTADGRPVDFRFSSGWLIVERGEPGADPDADMVEILSVPISPFGTMDILPEQICDILGLTVNGHKVDLPPWLGGSRGFDWSGRTTYWESTHRMLSDWDAEPFTEEVCRAFPGSIIIQPAWYKGPYKLRCRQIRFLMSTDDVATIGVGYDKSRLETLLAADEVPIDDFESVFEFSIEFSRAESPFEDITGKQYIDSRGAAKLALEYSTMRHRKYRIRTNYRTEDARAQDRMRKLQSVIDSYFGRGLEVVDLRSGKVLRQDLSDEEDSKSYSRKFRDWCFANPARFLYVWWEKGAAGENDVFVGMRPLR